MAFMPDGRLTRRSVLAAGLGAGAPGAETAFTVAGLRLMPKPWDKEANFRKLERGAREAAARGARLVITPESFLDGYVGTSKELRAGRLTREKYLEMAESLEDGAYLGRIQALARELKVYVLAGYPEARDGRVYNSLAIFGPDGAVAGRYSKTHCGGPAEPFNAEGDEFRVFDTPLGRWGALICLDRQLPETARILTLRGAQVVLVPSYGGHGEMNDLMMRIRAYENGVWLVFVHPNRCLIVDPRGRIAAQDDPAGGDQVITARVTLNRDVGGGPIRNRRPELYRELLGQAAPREGAAEFTVAGLQMMPERWDKEANFRKLERLAREAASRGANVVATPESFLDGYVANEKANRPFASREKYFAVGEAIDGPLLERVRTLAGELKVWLAAGFAERRGERMYNSVALFSPAGALALRYSKSHTANDEPYNTKGTEFPVAETPLGRWGMLICMDRQLPETSRILAVKGAQLILLPAWGGYNETNDIMMRTRAYENGVWLAFVHPKRCLIVDPRGNIVARNTGEGEQIVTARVKLSGGPEPSPIRFRRPEIYGEIVK